jgi:uncharacterized protein YjbJ (UPF0337 family)
MAGTSDKLEGKIKEGVGKATNDRHLESEGKGQHAAGSLKDAADDVKDKAKNAADDVADKAKDAVDDVRDRASRH